MSRWSLSCQLAAAQFSLATAHLALVIPYCPDDKISPDQLPFHEHLLALQNALAANQPDMERIHALRLAAAASSSYLRAQTDSSYSLNWSSSGAARAAALPESMLAAVQAWNLAWKVFQAAYWDQS